jgi:hypothetical protein
VQKELVGGEYSEEVWVQAGLRVLVLEMAQEQGVHPTRKTAAEEVVQGQVVPPSTME